MRQIVRRLAFNFGFFIGIAILALFNWASFLHSDQAHISHASHSFGFPFSIYFWGFFEPDRFLVLGFALDMATAVFFGLFLGIAFQYGWMKITTRALR